MNVLMPQLGETVTEGTIGRWYKSVGEQVTVGEILLEVESDKTAMEVPAVSAGILGEICARTGETVAVGAVIAVVVDDEVASPLLAQTFSPTGTAEALAPPHSTRAEHAVVAYNEVASPPPVQTSGPVRTAEALALPASPAREHKPIDPFHGLRTPERNFGRATSPNGVKVTPRARRLAAEADADLERVQGSGPGGRIVAADVLRFGRNAASVMPRDLLRAVQPEAVRAFYEGSPYREVPLDAMRHSIARRLSQSKQEVPHFYVSGDLEVEQLLTLREQFNQRSATRLSVNDLMVKAYAMALQRVPGANVAWAADRLLEFEHVDLSIAVALPGGVVTPVLRRADTKGVATLSAEIAELVARGRARRLQPSEYTGGSATVTNLGMYGVRSFQAIVNPPQATILAVGAAQRRPWVAQDGGLRAVNQLTVCISVDHRAIDGALAGELLAALRDIVEHPISLLM